VKTMLYHHLVCTGRFWQSAKPQNPGQMPEYSQLLFGQAVTYNKVC
jgi:hypothetical protein